MLAVGDCNTCGITVPPIGNTILDKFCRHVRQSGCVAESQNLGCGMATTREGLTLLRTRARPADVLLLNFGLVDTWVTSIPRFYVSYYPESFAKKRLRKLLKFVKRRLRSPWLRKYVPVGHVVPLDEFDQNIRAMIDIVRTANPAVEVLIWGSPPVQGDAPRNHNLQRFNHRLESLAQELRATYLSTDEIMQEMAASAAYVDAVHLGENATDRIAAGLFASCQSAPLAAAG